MRESIVVHTTCDRQEAAARVAAHLVEKRLAACVQLVGPVTSTYRWQGKVETSQEWLCVAKTHADRFDRVEQAIREVHEYDVPEIVALPIVAGSGDYLRWLDEQLG